MGATLRKISEKKQIQGSRSRRRERRQNASPTKTSFAVFVVLFLFFYFPFRVRAGRVARFRRPASTQSETRRRRVSARLSASPQSDPGDRISFQRPRREVKQQQKKVQTKQGHADDAEPLRATRSATIRDALVIENGHH